MKHFQSGFCFLFCLLLISCQKTAEDIISGKCTISVPGFTAQDSGAVAYAISKADSQDGLSDVTYRKFDGVYGVDTTINKPTQPYFWESPVIKGQSVLLIANGNSPTHDMYGRITVYNSKGVQVYTDTALCK